MSSFFQQLAIETPFALWALALLPIIWWLLRATPPRPRQQAFPPIRILLGLPRQQETPDKTPWWLLLLRLTIAALFCLAVAHPFLQPVSSKRLPSGDRLIIVDNGWQSGKDWPKRQTLLLDVLRRAQEDGSAVRLAATNATAASQDLHLMPAEVALEKARLLQPASLPTDRMSLVEQLKLPSSEPAPTSVLWLTDGFDSGTSEKFAKALQMQFPKAAIHVLAEATESYPLALGPLQIKGSDINVEMFRPDGGSSAASLSVKSVNGRTITDYAVDFGSSTAKHLTINLPSGLRNQIRSITITGENQAGATQLFDDRWRRKTIALMAGDTSSESQLLLSPLHYLRRGLEPFAELNEPQNATDLQNEIDAGLSMLVLADVGEVQPDIKPNLTSWIEKGGILLRFAGPRLAAGGDDLLPVPLRQGDRNLGSALSWDQPQGLSPFPENSPFAGLEPDPSIRITRQVLADPTPDMAQRTWASLTDGTPLVTAEKRGKGMIVLFHVTSNASWSNLPLSGLFLEMLQSIGNLDPAQAAVSTNDVATDFAPQLVLNGFGELVPPDAGMRAIPASEIDKARPGPATPPGLYVRQGQARALNLQLTAADLAKISATVSGLPVETQEQAKKRDLSPFVFLLMAAFFLLDTFITLFIGGGLLRRSGMATAAIMAVLLFTPPPAKAAQADQDAALTTRLACVKTGNDDIDRTCMQGLSSLTAYVDNRTSATLSDPVSVDVTADELVFYPLLYWPVDENAKPLDDATRARITTYMKNGGTIFFDTRDGGIDMTGGGGNAALKTLLDKLDLPQLELTPEKHVLTRSFYLLSDFPGRFEGPRPWVEAENDGTNADPSTSDGVSSIIIGANDYAAAWAEDDNGQPLYATVPGSDRQREFAIRTGINVVMYALTGNYKADQVHVPALLERLGQ